MSPYAVGVAKRPSTSLWTPAGTERIVVLQGPDAFLRSEYAGALRALLTKKLDEIDVLRFDGQSASAADVLDECRSFGLMQQHKLVLVDQADQLVKEDNRPLLERYAQSPCDAATLVLRSEKWNRGKLDALIKKVGVIVRCEPLEESAGVQWMSERAKGVHRVMIEPRAAGALFDRLNGDLGRIDTELAKLAVMASSGSGDSPKTKAAMATITLETVLEQSGTKGLDDPWQIQHPLLSGDPQRAVGYLRRLLEDNPKDLMVPISWAMVDLAGQIHQAASLMARGAAAGSVGSRLKLWPREKADRVVRVARTLSPERTLAFYSECVRNDRAIKSGLGRPADRVERIALGFASLGRP